MKKDSTITIEDLEPMLKSINRQVEIVRKDGKKTKISFRDEGVQLKSHFPGLTTYIERFAKPNVKTTIKGFH